MQDYRLSTKAHTCNHSTQMVEAGSRAGGSLGYRERLCLRRKGEGKGGGKNGERKNKERKKGRTRKKEEEERLGIQIWLDTK